MEPLPADTHPALSNAWAALVTLTESGVELSESDELELARVLRSWALDALDGAWCEHPMDALAILEQQIRDGHSPSAAVQERLGVVTNVATALSLGPA